MISSDEDDNTPGYPIDSSSDSGEEKIPTTAPSGNPIDERSGGVDTNDAVSGKEEEGPKAGTYLECRVCGTIYDLVQCKSKQPWHVVFVGRTVGVFKHL